MDFLFKIFIKDCENTQNEEVRRNYGVFGGIVGICLNIILFAFKLAAGLLTNSIGIVADAMNNISDAGSSVITLIGFKLSGKPANNDHPFGHGRIEYISALFVSVAILLMGFELAKSSAGKIIHPEEVEFKAVSVIILIAAILVKTWMYFFNRKIGRKIDSNSMLATAKDSLSDSVSTAAVLLGTLIAYFADVNLDGYIGFAVSIFILITGIGAVKDSISPLLGQSPEPELVSGIEEIVMSHGFVLGIHDMVIHDYGPTRFMVSLHAEVSANGNILEIHDGIDHIERELSEKFGCEAVIHMDPIEVDNELVNQTRETVRKILSEISPELTFHDFRMVSGPTHTNLIFDVVVPHGFGLSKTELDEEIKKKIGSYNETWFTVIDYDTEYAKK